MDNSLHLIVRKIKNSTTEEYKIENNFLFMCGYVKRIAAKGGFVIFNT